MIGQTVRKLVYGFFNYMSWVVASILSTYPSGLGTHAVNVLVTSAAEANGDGYGLILASMTLLTVSPRRVVLRFL